VISVNFPSLQALARLGAEVTGIDLAKANIRIAQEHAKLDPRVDSKVQYLNVAAGMRGL